MAMITISAFIYTYFQLVMWMIHCLHRHHHPCKLLLPSQLPATMKPQIITYCQCNHCHGPCIIAYSCFVVSILWMIWRHFHFRSQVWKCQKFKVHHVDASQGGWSSILFSSFCSLYLFSSLLTFNLLDNGFTCMYHYCSNYTNFYQWTVCCHWMIIKIHSCALHCLPAGSNKQAKQMNIYSFIWFSHSNSW